MPSQSERQSRPVAAEPTPDCPYCAERLRVNVGLLERNRQLREQHGKEMTPTPEEAREIAHSAYHDHNQNCSCKTVGHLTAWIAHRLLGIEPQIAEEYYGAF